MRATASGPATRSVSGGGLDPRPRPCTLASAIGARRGVGEGFHGFRSSAPEDDATRSRIRNGKPAPVPPTRAVRARWTGVPPLQESARCQTPRSLRPEVARTEPAVELPAARRSDRKSPPRCSCARPGKARSPRAHLRGVKHLDLSPGAEGGRPQRPVRRGVKHLVEGEGAEVALLPGRDLLSTSGRQARACAARRLLSPIHRTRSAARSIPAQPPAVELRSLPTQRARPCPADRAPSHAHAPTRTAPPLAPRNDEVGGRRLIPHLPGALPRARLTSPSKVGDDALETPQKFSTRSMTCPLEVPGVVQQIRSRQFACAA